MMGVTRVDGNALAGRLSDVFQDDVTVMRGECSGCGAEALLATAVVEIDERGCIALCRGCTHTLFTVLRGPDGTTLVLGTLKRLRIG